MNKQFRDMPQRDIDIRVFQRYPFEVEFELIIGNRSFKARTTDYSMTSVGVIIDGEGEVHPGDRVSLNISELNIRQYGEVIWVTQHSGSLRAGIAKTGTLAGNFRRYRLSDIFIGFQRTLKNGILDINDGAVNKKVYIKNGNIIYAESNQDSDRLGDILLREGRISDKDYALAAERKKRTNERYVSILVEEGHLRPADLLGAIELQATKIVESLFTMEGAAFEFFEADAAFHPPVTLELAVAELIYREVKKNAEAEVLMQYLPDSLLDFSSTPLNLFQNIRLDPADQRLLSYIDGRSTVREIIRAYSLNMEETLRSFYALLEARILEPKETGDPPTGISPHSVCNSREEAYCDIIDKIDEMYLKLGRADYYELLEVERQASAEEIRKAYFRAARTFHPDMHIGLPYDIKEKLVSIFSEINKSYLTLKDFGKRSRYNQASSEEAAHKSSSPGNTTAGAAAAGAGGSGAPFDSDNTVNAGIARSKYEEGKAMFRKKHFDEAVNIFASAIYFDSSHPEYHFHYGCGLEKTGKLKEAMQSLNRAFEMAPNNPDILSEIGHIYLKIGCPLRARGNFNRAMALAPFHQRAMEGLADLEAAEAKGKKK